MREQLNSNLIAQIALVGILVAAAGFLLLGGMGGGSGSSTAPTSSSSSGSASGSTTAATSTRATAPAAVGTAAPAAPSAAVPEVPAPPLPRPVASAYAANRVVVLLVVRPSGVDDRLVLATVSQLRAAGGVATFIVPLSRISRYSAMTQGVSVDRVPALLVLRKRSLTNGSPQASVHYGFQSAQSIVQAVRDATYSGPAATYQP